MTTRPETRLTLLAHGIGGRQDLPIPFSYALLGGAIAVLVSFAALGMLWQTPRLSGEQAGRVLPSRAQQVLNSRWLRGALRLVGLGLTTFVAVATVWGKDNARNPTAGFVYVIFWVGLAPASLLLGPIWRWLNPLRTIHAALAGLLRVPANQGIATLPSWLGYWPAAAGLFAFTWLELVAPDRTSTVTLKVAFASYAGVNLLGATVFGSAWFHRCDAFEVYSSLIGRLAPIGRREDGQWTTRNPLAGLAGLRPAPGLVGVVCVVIGSTAYDGFSSSPYWVNIVQSASLPSIATGTLGLLGMIITVVGTYSLATWLAGLLGTVWKQAPQATPSRTPLSALPGQFAHSIVPIGVGYVIAHYFSLFLFEGQRTLIVASDPLGAGADIFHMAGREVDYTVVSPATIAMVQVLGVVVGHVLGTIAAHDRAIRLFPRGQALVGQLPLLLLMVGYTVGGLLLLFAG